ncbi:MAG: permease-like cell division protein FtsX [Erysipelotrichaceae bacterium]
MIRFIKSLPYHIKTAFKSVARHFAISLSASSAVMVTLLLTSMFLMITTNVSSFTKGIEEGIQIHVTVDPLMSEEKQIAKLQTKLEGIENVKKVVFSNKDKELKAFIKEKGKIWSVYEGSENPLRDAFIVDVKDADSIDVVSKQILKIDGFEKAEYGGSSINTMISLFKSIRDGGLVFVIALSILAIFLIQNTIKMTIYARNKEISIMRNVGAVNWFIKTPFMIEGMIIGLMGSVIPVLVTCFGYQYIYSQMGNGSFSMFQFQPVFPFVFILSGILILSGVLVGAIGSFLSVSKYLRWRR